MNIMVYDIAAESGGATSILNYFYERHKEDKSNHYYYMLSVFHLDETDNISVINVPEIKKGWISRLIFDYVGVKKYLKKYGINEVISLQNTIIPCFNGKQIVYEHNALPFSEYRFSLKEDKLMWVYQNIIGRFMLFSIRKADKVIVQTEWMKSAISKRVNKSADKIQVLFPEVSVPKGYQYTQTNETVFFYPANGARFKNHELIIKACEILKKDGINDYKIAFTLNGDENSHIQTLFDRTKDLKLNIEWLGLLPREDVFSWYQKSVLLFPSYIETIGLPIYEAKAVGSPMLLADCQYAHDVAGNYENKQFFKYSNAKELASLMKKYISTN